MRTTPRATFPSYADRARFERIDERAEHFDPTERIEEIRQEFRAISRRVESDDIDRDGARDDLRELRRDLAALDEHGDARYLAEEIREYAENVLRGEVSR